MGAKGDLVEMARQAVRTGETVEGLTPLSGGLTHDVFAVEDRDLVVKVYRSWGRSEPAREWQTLCAVVELGLGPTPVSLTPADGVEPPVVVMGRVRGQDRPACDLRPDDLAAIAEAHRAFHRLSMRRDQLPVSHPLTVLKRTQDLISSWEESEIPSDRADEINAAGDKARRWLQDGTQDLLVGASDEVFSRGDPNLTNYLWMDDGLILIDFEDAGIADPSIELADFFEHASSRGLLPEYWSVMCDLYGLDQRGRLRADAGRKLLACFWLAVLYRRYRDGAGPVNLTLEDQAVRVLALLG